MKVVYSDAHEAFDPKGAWFDGRTLPPRETPRRLHIIKDVVERRRGCQTVAPTAHGPGALTRLHSPEYVAFVQEISAATPPITIALSDSAIDVRAPEITRAK